MERNVQIKKLRRPRLQNAIIGGAAFAALFLVTACGRGGQMEDAYSFDSRATAFSSSGTGNEGRGAAFAGDLCVVSGENDTDEILTAEAAGVFDLSGGTALFQKNALQQMNPASTTKIMTALLALKYGNLSDLVTVTDAAVITEAGSSMAGILPGDKLTLEQLLYGLMMPSGNDAANAIAVHIAGSVEAFADMMNEEAWRIGATGTHFVNANGLTAEGHYTTAYDLYLMFHEALGYETFREIIGTHSYTAVYEDGNGEEKISEWTIGNYYMNGKRETPAGLTVFGGKTGTTQAAGYCLVMGSRTGDGREYASVIMKADSRDALYADMTKIISKIVK